MRSALLAMLLLTASCSNPGLTDAQRDEVDDVAEAAVVESPKVRDLEGRIDALEERLNR